MAFGREVKATAEHPFYTGFPPSGEANPPSSFDFGEARKQQILEFIKNIPHLRYKPLTDRQ